jgi:sialate O-acetylesterase
MSYRHLLVLSLAALAIGNTHANAETPPLKVHGVFSSNMVLQRDQPIKVWGWAPPGSKVAVSFGNESSETTADGGRWKVEFPAREADIEPRKLVIRSGNEAIEMDNILIGDVWVMNGQSNMKWGLEKTIQSDLERAQSNLPLFRRLGISPNEQSTLQDDIPADKIDGGGWLVSDPETAGSFSAIGYAFGSRLQRALGIPIGIIDNARGGASIESLVPAHKFDDHPVAAAYKKHLDQRIAEFDAEAEVERQWQNQLNRAKSKGVPEEKWPKRGTVAELRSWNIPGKSPSDAASCYNGMFGAFKGLGIKGVLFHQGYNNAMGSSCRPKRYRALMQLMVEGWREDFESPALPVGVIGFCAGGIPQTEENFEVWTVAPSAYIREAQRLGLADVGDPENTAFLPAYDVQIPGLHPFKKRDHGERAARWALNRVYDLKVGWDSASLVSAERDGDRMVLTFDKKVMPDDMSTVIEGFAIAGPDQKFYRAHATWPLTKDAGIWNTANKSYDATKVIVWSPLVPEPSAVRYAWATSAAGNLKVDGKPWQPLHSFRTDDWDWPEIGPESMALDRGQLKQLNAEAAERLEFRRTEEAKRAVEILERLKTLGRAE